MSRLQHVSSFYYISFHVTTKSRINNIVLISRIDGVRGKMEQPQFLFREKFCADVALLVKQSYVRIVQYFIRSFAPTAWLSVYGIGGAYGLDTVDHGDATI